MFDQALGFFDHHLGHLDVTGGRLIEGRAHDLAFHRARHVGHFLGPLVDQQDEEVDLRVVGGDRVGDILQHHRLAGPGRSDDQGALALAQRRDQIDHPGRQILGRGILDLELHSFFRIKRRQVVEIDPVADVLRWPEIDVLDLEKREVPLAILGRANPPLDRVAGAQGEPSDLARRNIDVIGTRQVVRLRRAQEAETVLEDFQDAVSEYGDVVLRQLLEDGEHHVLLAQAAGVLDFEVFRVGQKVRR